MFSHMGDFAEELTEKRAFHTGCEPTPRNEIDEIINWINFYSNNRNVYLDADFDPYDVDYHPRDLLKDAFAIIWEESWFINEPDQDNGTGFGWAAMQWNTAKDLQSRVYDWEEISQNKLYKHREQAKYMVGYLLWLKNHYGDRHRTILGYNKGPGVIRINGQTYFNRFVEKRRILDSRLDP